MIYDSVNNMLWLTSYSGNQIQKFNTTVATPVLQGSYPPTPTITDQSPWGIEFYPNGANSRIWVVNAYSNDIQRYDTSGNKVGTPIYRSGTESSKLYFARQNASCAVNIQWFMPQFGPLTVTSPNGTETGANAWKVGDQKYITWKYADSLFAYRRWQSRGR